MGALFAPGDPVETLQLLDELGVTVILDRPTGQLHARPVPVPPVVRELIMVNRPLLHAVLTGKRTGHAWARCDECDEGRMVQTSRVPRCAMTPGCKGRHRR
jgi:hypothetical protein